MDVLPREQSALLGVVFAGGGSTRMGGDKALLRWPLGFGSLPGRIEDGPSISLVERAGRVLDGFCRTVEIAAGPEDRGGARLPGPWTSFPDAAPGIRASQLQGPGPPVHGSPATRSPKDGEAPPGAGPLGGLVAALERAQGLGLTGTAVLACDMPLVEAPDFEPLLERIDDGADVAMWTVEGPGGAFVDQPLVAVYGPEAHVAARAALESGARRLVALSQFCAADGRPLRVDRVPAEENSSLRLVNVNTPSDYHGAVATYLSLGPRDRGTETGARSQP